MLGSDFHLSGVWCSTSDAKNESLNRMTKALGIVRIMMYAMLMLYNLDIVSYLTVSAMITFPNEYLKLRCWIHRVCVVWILCIHICYNVINLCQRYDV